MDWAGLRFSGPGGIFVVGMLVGAFILMLFQIGLYAWLCRKEAKRG